MIVSQGKYVLQRKWAYMSRVSINYLRVKKVIEAFCTRKDKAKIKSTSRLMDTAGYSCESYLSGEKHSVKILRVRRWE